MRFIACTLYCVYALLCVRFIVRTLYCAHAFYARTLFLLARFIERTLYWTHALLRAGFIERTLYWACAFSILKKARFARNDVNFRCDFHLTKISIPKEFFHSRRNEKAEQSKRSSHSGVPWCAKISRSKLVSLLFCGCKPCNSGENGGLDIKGGEESVKERRRRSNAEVSEMSLKRARAR